MIVRRSAMRFFCVAQSSVCLGSTAAAADPPATSPPTAAQTIVFAEMVDDTPATVGQRLHGDAALGPLVVAAVDAHEERKRTGMALVVTGGDSRRGTDAAPTVRRKWFARPRRAPAPQRCKRCRVLTGRGGDNRDDPKVAASIPASAAAPGVTTATGQTCPPFTFGPAKLQETSQPVAIW
jgi:hypothetical protein